MRQTLPSTAPLLCSRVSPLATAAWSLRMPRVKECRLGRSSWSAAAIQAGRRSPWRPAIISANAVTCPAAAFSSGLRALTWLILAVSSSVRWSGWLVIQRVTSRTVGGGGGSAGAVSAARSGCR